MYTKSQTPTIIKNLIVTIISVSLASALFNKLSILMFGIGPQEILSLSSWGIRHMMLWEIFTHLIVHPSLNSISLSFLMDLAFNMLVLWQIGPIILARFGKRHFLKLYLGIPILMAAGLAFIISQTNINIYLSGCLNSTYSLLIIWCILYTEDLILLFNIIPLKVKWVVSIIIGVSLLINLSQLNFFGISLTSTVVILTYLYAILVLELRTNNHYLDAIEKTLLYYKDKITIRESKYSNEKIYSIKSGRPINDDHVFMDAMLEKISRKGEKSLSWGERRRMDKISKRNK